MMLKLSAQGRLRRTIQSVALGGLAVSGMSAPQALAQEAEEAVQLDKVEVTGSRIRRVDVETASPIFVIDRASIESSGVATLGDLLQEIPSIAGAATNPSVNNGGGSGVSGVSLRGLGTERTLVLLNGRRLSLAPQFSFIDINAIPINMIERVEVLKDGASAIYGSDAIGGVVNFITRKGFSGSEFLSSYGATTRGDGELTNLYTTFGVPSNSGGVIMGLTYDQRQDVSSADRPFSAQPFALYNGQQISFGSSRIPNGFYSVSQQAAQAGGADLSNPECGISPDDERVVLTRITGRSGDDISDFRCYVGGGPNNDTFNFQSDNVNVTPQERYGAFMSGSWAIGSAKPFGISLFQDVEVYTDAIFHQTTSNFQIAAEPFDGRPSQAGVTFSADSIFNPFGEDINDLRLRLNRVGRRTEEFETQKQYIVAGVKGISFDSWYWDLYTIQARDRQNTQARGELFLPGLQDAVGPSFVDENGDARCGTPDAPISNCTPVDFFGQFDPNDQTQITALNALAPNFHDRHNTDLQSVAFNIAGDAFQLPAGPLGVALGYEFRKEEADSDPDFLRTQGLNSGNQASPVSGGFDVNEVFVEAAVPLVSGLPLINSLELSLGARFSDYSTFGDTFNGKVGIQYRPLENLLVRANYAEVFRAPTIIDLFGGANESAETYQDPCNGVSSPQGQNVNIDAACQNVPRDGNFQQSDTQLNAIVGSNAALQPEEGDVITLGFVYSAPFGLEPLTIEVDAFRVSLTDTIGEVGTQNRLDGCFNQGLFCDSFTRDDIGQIFLLNDVTQNIGNYDTDGIDIGLRYDFGNTALGNFNWSIDSTWLHESNNQRVAGNPATLVRNVGRFNESSAGGDGHFARWRALSQLRWGYDKVSANLSSRFIGSVTEVPTEFGTPGDPGFVANRKVGSQVIHDIQVSYALDEYKTLLSFGIDNVTDKLAPLIYSGFNGTTDVRTYDVLGTFYWARLKFSFE